MKAVLHTYWITESGWNISGNPDVCEIDIPEGCHHAGDTFDTEDGRIMRVRRRKNGVLILETRKVHVPIVVKESAA